MRNLKKLNFGSNELLQREQMRTILGGDPLMHEPGDGPCGNYTEAVPTGCPCSSSLPCASGYYQSGGGTVYSSGSCENGICGL